MPFFNSFTLYFCIDYNLYYLAQAEPLENFNLLQIILKVRSLTLCIDNRLLITVHFGSTLCWVFSRNTFLKAKAAWLIWLLILSVATILYSCIIWPMYVNRSSELHQRVRLSRNHWLWIPWSCQYWWLDISRSFYIKHDFVGISFFHWLQNNI